jgi:hypothetical protein
MWSYTSIPNGETQGQLYLLFHNVMSSLSLSSWEAGSHSASPEIPRLLWNPKVHCRVHWSLSWPGRIQPTPSRSNCSLWYMYSPPGSRQASLPGSLGACCSGVGRPFKVCTGYDKAANGFLADPRGYSHNSPQMTDLVTFLVLIALHFTFRSRPEAVMAQSV